MFKNNISILIPTHNDACTDLVHDLKIQADRIVAQTSGNFAYEIIVADDGSTDMDVVKQNNDINSMEHCRYIRRKQNVGRAQIRNFLVSQSHGAYILFVDSDLFVNDSHYLEKYITAEDYPVIYGGTIIGGEPDKLKGNLRYIYEKKAEAAHRAKYRALKPNKEISVCNTFVQRDIAVAHPFDNRIKVYGYEDVLWGKRLYESNIQIFHLENPMKINVFEDNAIFLKKTEESLHALHDFQTDLHGYSNIGNTADKLCRLIPKSIFVFWHKIMGRLEKQNLLSHHPNLTIFKLYKLGYYLSLYTQKEEKRQHPTKTI